MRPLYARTNPGEAARAKAEAIVNACRFVTWAILLALAIAFAYGAGREGFLLLALGVLFGFRLGLSYVGVVVAELKARNRLLGHRSL